MKKLIKTLAMVAVMFVAVSTVAHAQRGGGRNPVTILKDSLHVSDVVAAKADSIYKAYQATTAPLMEAARGGDADARAKMTEARNKMTEGIKMLLTEEQKAKYDELTRMGRRGGGR